MENEYEIKPVVETEYEFVSRELTKDKLHLMDLISLAVIGERFKHSYKKQYRKNVLKWDKVIDDDKILDFISEISPIIRAM